eukprot:593620-Pelagomonas_calceolata.AAC.4
MKQLRERAALPRADLKRGTCVKLPFLHSNAPICQYVAPDARSLSCTQDVSVLHLMPGLCRALFLQSSSHNFPDVGDCVRACTWNLHAKVWEMQPEPLCSSNEEQHSIVVPSMALIYPSRLPFPQQQQQPPQQHIQLNFKAYITAPSPFRLTGWYGSEEGHIQEGVDDGNCLQLLARAHGRFLPVDIVQQGTRDEGGVQGVQEGTSFAFKKKTIIPAG